MLLMCRFNTRSNGDFLHGTLQIYEAEKCDAGAELFSAVGTSREEYHRKRLLSVKNATAGGTIYYSKKFSNEAVEISWQANAYDRDDLVKADGRWYAPSLETYFRHDALKVLQHVIKRCKSECGASEGWDDLSPRQIVDALMRKDDLIFVRYDGDNYDLWLPMQGEPEHLDKAPVKVPA